MEVTNDSFEVNAVPKQDPSSTEETVVVTVDSGAHNTVGPKHVGTHFDVKPTEASKAGRHYSAANGSIIKNYGQRVIVGKDENGTTVSLPIQVADVKKVLGSVREMVKSKNRIVFDEDEQGRSCSYVEYKPTGQKTVIHERNGTFQFSIKVPKGKGGGVEEVMEGGEGVRAEGFPRPGTLQTDLFY